MLDFLILILLVIVIARDLFYRKQETKEPEKIDEVEAKKQEKLREEFENLVNYSESDAIESKKG